MSGAAAGSGRGLQPQPQRAQADGCSCRQTGLANHACAGRSAACCCMERGRTGGRAGEAGAALAGYQRGAVTQLAAGCHAQGAHAPARPEQPSQWPMLDLTLPMSSGASADRPAPAPYMRSIAPSSCASPTTVPVPCASTYTTVDRSTPAAAHTCAARLSVWEPPLRAAALARPLRPGLRTCGRAPMHWRGTGMAAAHSGDRAARALLVMCWRQKACAQGALCWSSG